MTRRPRRSTLFPSTTLFRSAVGEERIEGIARRVFHAPVEAPLRGQRGGNAPEVNRRRRSLHAAHGVDLRLVPDGALQFADLRSEEHTSELQSQSNLVCRLLL